METCRICRCEETPEEPLFYPCKCSGSIKYVHQECLQVWLKSSSKKSQVCELCNTEFLFTKIYSPDMPKDLPVGVFWHHFSVSLIASAKTGLRYFFASFAWLAVVPFAALGFATQTMGGIHKVFFDKALRAQIGHYPIASTLLPQALWSHKEKSDVSLFVHYFEAYAFLFLCFLIVVIPFFVHEWVLNCAAFRQELDRIEEEDIKQRHAQAVADVVKRLGMDQNRTDDVEQMIENLNQFRRQQENHLQNERQEMEQLRRMQEEINRQEDVREQQAQEAVPADEDLMAALGGDNTLLGFLGFTGPLKGLFQALYTTYTSFMVFTGAVLFIPYSIGRLTMFTIEKNVDSINYCIDGVLNGFTHILRMVFGPTWFPEAGEVVTYHTKFYDPTSIRAHMFELTVGYVCIISLITLCIKIWKPSLPVHFKQFLKLVEAMLKVMIMFGVELLVFPFCCGLLLHFSILPLFGDVSTFFWSRVALFAEYPLMNIVLHWAGGTFYMIQFAMFVSMCRGQMRTGVLYFVRNPNDPSYQPVQEVLEKSILFQFKRIMISGGMYAIFIGVCIGFVTLLYQQLLSGSLGLLPLTLDISFEPFWMSKPLFHIGLHICLSSFLISQIDGKGVANFIWSQVLKRTSAVLCLSSFIFNSEQKSEQVAEGCFVRAPSSDSVSLKKSKNFFVEVTKDDVLVESAKSEAIDSSVNDEEVPPLTSSDYVVVYRPPNFRPRIFALLCTVWFCGAFFITALVAAPLLMGRLVYKIALCNIWQEFSDIEALSIGAPLVAGLYLAFSTRSLSNIARFAGLFASGVALLAASSTCCELYFFRTLELVYKINAPTISRAVPTGFMLLAVSAYLPTYTPIFGPLVNPASDGRSRVVNAVVIFLAIPLPGVIGRFLDVTFNTSIIHICIYPAILAVSTIPLAWTQISRYLTAHENRIRDKLYVTGKKLHNRD